MASFVDEKDTTWTMRFDALILRELRQALKVDLTAEGGKDFDRMSEDTELLVNVLWHLLQSQTSAAGIDVWEFASRITGEGIDRAVDCLREAVNSFLPPSKRKVFQTNLAENQAYRAEARGRVIAKVKDPELKERFLTVMDEQMEEKIRETLTRLRNASAGPEQSESAPPA